MNRNAAVTFFSAWLSTKCQKRTQHFVGMLTNCNQSSQCQMVVKYVVMLNLSQYIQMYDINEC